MAKKQVILTGVQAREELAKGAEKLASAVSSTMGPYGQNFFLDKGNRITNDGVTVAREIILQEEIQNLGASALREAAVKTNEEAGDGTTSAVTLAWAIYQAMTRYLPKEGVMGKKTPSELVRQIEKEKNEVISLLTKTATPVETKEQLVSSAVVSVEDKELGELIGNAQWDLGKNGYLLVEETAEKKSSVEHEKGIRIDNGFGTSMLINNQEKQRLEVKDSYVILTSYTLHNLRPLEKVINQLVKAGRTTIAVVARAWTEEAIKLCLENIKNGLTIYPLNAPYIDMQQKFLDLQAVTGAKFYDSEGTSLEDISIQDVGFAKRITANRYSAIITGSDDILTSDRVAKRVTELQGKLDGSMSDFEKNILEERIAQLQNGFATVKVGSYSDMERKRLYDKCEDAVHAVRAAFQEGTVKGAGMAFKEISESLPDDYLLKRPLLAIYEQIRSTSPSDFVIEDWVRDPVKVLRVALTNACSAASAFATAGGAVAQKNPSSLDELFKKAE